MFLGAQHKKDTQCATPNRLEASFKSNKCESMYLSHHKCFLRWTRDELTQRLNLTPQISLTPIPLVNPWKEGL
jgi:hypothetical protein